MAERSKTCPKCGSRMAAGALLAKDSNGSRGAVQWLQGAIEKSFWSGVKTRGREVLPVTAFRCTRCGFVEHYAEG